MSRAVTNFSLALLYAYFAATHVVFMYRTGAWFTTTPVIVQETMLVVLFMIRREGETSPLGFDWIIGIAGTFVALLVRPTAPSMLTPVGLPIQLVGLWIVVVALATLGRSIGIVAANRGVVTTGIYSVIRHPMYLGHMMCFTGYLICNPSLRNMVIVPAVFLLLNLRVEAEEEWLLETDPRYLEYIDRTWRFVPGVW